jgi:hypothetical protein
VEFVRTRTRPVQQRASLADPCRSPRVELSSSRVGLPLRSDSWCPTCQHSRDLTLGARPAARPPTVGGHLWWEQASDSRNVQWPRKERSTRWRRLARDLLFRIRVVNYSCGAALRMTSCFRDHFGRSRQPLQIVTRPYPRPQAENETREYHLPQKETTHLDNRRRRRCRCRTHTIDFGCGACARR